MSLTIPGYKVIKELGEGGMGIVYLAREESLDTLVAIKLLHRQFTTKEQVRERFKNEARMMASLVHTNIVQFRQFLSLPEGLALVMEYVEGRGLDRMIGEEFGPIPWDKAVPIFTQMLNGLGYAHSKGIIHRDIKPSNIIVSDSGEVKITDFGIAKIAGQGNLTRTGMQMGTLYYESPEQIRGAKKVDHRSDIYSMGMTLYEMLAGRLPFDTDESVSEFDITQKIVFQENPPPSQFYPHIPPWLVSIVEKATAKEPDQRFQTCEEFLEALNSRMVDSAESTKPSINTNSANSAMVGSASVKEPVSPDSAATRKRFPKAVIGVVAVVALVAVLAFSGVLSGPPDSTGTATVSHSSSNNSSSVVDDSDYEEDHEVAEPFDYVETIRPEVISSLANSCRNRLVRESELDELSYRELKLLRNYFFAYYDRPFAVQWIRSYFQENMPSYRGNGPSDPNLTDTERENVNRVIQYEQDHNIPVMNN